MNLSHVLNYGLLQNGDTAESVIWDLIASLTSSLYWIFSIPLMKLIICEVQNKLENRFIDDL